jgi:homocysteine S-methyltransferase
MAAGQTEYFGVYAKRLIKLGVRVVGGCCGTTPDHIRELVGSVKMRAAAAQTSGSGRRWPACSWTASSGT